MVDINIDNINNSIEELLNKSIILEIQNITKTYKQSQIYQKITSEDIINATLSEEILTHLEKLETSIEQLNKYINSYTNDYVWLNQSIKSKANLSNLSSNTLKNIPEFKKIDELNLDNLNIINPTLSLDYEPKNIGKEEKNE